MSMAELSSDIPPEEWPQPGLRQGCREVGIVTWGQEGPPPGMVMEPDWQERESASLGES